MKGIFFLIFFLESAILTFKLLVLKELPCHRDICGVAGIVIPLRIDEDAVIDAFAEHQYARDGMELVRFQIGQMLFDEVVVSKRVELEVEELRIGELNNAGDITAHRLDFLLLASELRIDQHRHLRHIESTCG